MKSMFAIRRALTAAGLVLMSLLVVPSALATHLRGGTIAWKVISTTSSQYTVQFTFTESQRWSYPNAVGSCTGSVAGSTTYCVPVGTAVTLQAYSGGIFYFGDGNSTSTAAGTVTSFNQAQDYATAIFTFTHIYNIAAGPETAYFLDTNRIGTLKIGSNEPEYISTIVQNYVNPSPVVSVPAILSVPLQNTATFNLATAVSDIDPNVTLVYRLSTFAEIFGTTITYVPCPLTGGPAYTQGGVPSGNPPGFNISSTGSVTWNESQIQSAVSAGNCGFGVPAAGDLWTAQVMVEAHNKTTNALITKVPVDLLMELVSPVGDLPTITINPSATQNVNINTPVSFTAVGNSANTGAKVTLNVSGLPAGATATGLNATVTPPATSNFSWTPTALQAGSYVITYTVTDSNLQQAQASKTLVVATLPTISCSTAITPAYGSVGTVSASVLDPSNELLNVVWTVDGVTVRTDTGLTAYPTSYLDSLTQNFGAVGPHTVTATATDPHGVAVSCSPSVTVVPANQTITFGSLPTVTFGTADFALSASSTSGLPVAFSALGNCSFSSTTTVHLLGAGACQITASQAGNANYNAASPVQQTFTILPAAQVIQFNPVPSTPDFAGDSVVLSATGGASGNPVVFSVLSGNASLGDDGVTLTYTGAGTVVVAADQAGSTDGTGDYAAAQEVTATIVVNPAAAAYTAGTVPVAQQSSIQTATLNFPNGGTLGSVSYLTQGAANLDFIGCSDVGTKKPTKPKGGSSLPTSFACNQKTKNQPVIPVCGLGTTYAAGQICTVSYIFQPNYPGQRLGAISAVDNNGNAMGTSYISGLGSGPQVVFPGNTTTNGLGGGYRNPYGVAVDGAGDIFVADTFDGQIREIVAGQSSVATNVVSGLTGPIGIAVDGAGNVFFSDPDANVVKEIVAVSGSIPANPTVVTLSNTFSNPHGIALDGAGDVYVADYYNNAVKEIVAVAGSIPANPTILTLSSSFNQPSGVAVDGLGNVYVADTANNAIKEIVAVNGSIPASNPTILTLGGTFNAPADVTVDAAGNLYVASGTQGALEIVAVGGSIPASNATVLPLGTGIQNAQGIAVDGAGNVYVADTGGAILEIPLSTPPSINFADTNVGSASTSNPQTVTVANNGYDPTSTNPLTFSGVATGTTNFVLDAANACSTSTSLEPGQTCSLATDFTPQVSGSPLTDAVTLTDNNLNNILGTSSPQLVPLSGNGLQQTPTVTVAPATISYGTATVDLSATIAFAGTATPTGAVSFTIDTGSAVTASCTGTASPLTCTATYTSGSFGVPTHSIAASVAASPGFLTASGTNTLTVTPAGLGITIIGNPTKVYDGTRGVTLTPANYQITGLVGTDQIVISQTAGNYLSQNAGPEPVTAQILNSLFTATSGSLSNYILPSFATGSGTITPAGLGITIVGNPTKVYDGTTTATLSPANYQINGLVVNDQIAISQTVGTYHSANAGPEPVIAQISNDQFTAPSGSLGNYILPSFASGSGTITAAPLTVTAGNYSGVYDGSTHALSACSVSANFDGLTCTNNPVGPVGPNAGGAPVTPTVLGSTANYNVNTVLGVWSITQASSVTSINCPTSVVYNGSAQTPCTASVTGAGGLNQSVSVTYTLNTNVGQASASATFSGDTNHTSSSKSTTFNITPAPLTLTAGSYSGVYDGSTHALSACTVSANFDSLTCTNNPAGPVGPDVGGAVVLPAVIGSTANYTVNTINGVWSITQASSVTSINCPTSVVYNGSAQAPCTASVTGAGGLNQSVSVTYTANTNVGQASASATFSGDANHLASSKSTTFNITPAALTLTAGSYSGVYDGNTHALSACVASSNPDGLTCTNSPVGPVGPDVGGTTVTPVVSGSTSNYNVVAANGAWSITPLTVRLSAGSYSGVYDGNTHAPTDCGSNYPGVSCINSPVVVGPAVGKSYINAVASTPTTGIAADYTIFPGPLGLSLITAKPATVTPNASGKVYGAADPTLTGTAAGFLPADNIVVTYGRTAGETVAGSPYTISAAVAPNAGLANYTVTFSTAPFTISKLAASVTPNAAGKVYGTADPALTGTLSGFLPADGVTATYSRTAGETVAGSPYTISATLSPTAVLANYAITSNTAAFNITKATPVVSWTPPAGFTYGAPLSATQLNATASPSGGTFLYSPTAGTVLTAGVQTLSVLYTPSDTADYTTASATVPLAVSQATPVVTWNNPPSIVYGTPTGAAQKTATATGVGGVSLPGAFFYTTPDGTVFTVGTRPLGVAFTPTDIIDYVPVSAYATLTVTKATPTVTWSAPATIAYGTALSVAQLNATASVPGSFSYTPAAGTVLHAGAQTLSVTFTPTDTNDYGPITSTVPLTVSQGTPVVTWVTPPSIVYGTALSAAQQTATANVPGSFFYTMPTGTVFGAGTHPLGVAFTPTDQVDYQSVSAYSTITVTKATPTITWASPAAINYGTLLSATQLNAKASVPGTFLYSPAAGALLTGGTQILSVTFTPTDAADYNSVAASTTIVVKESTVTLGVAGGTQTYPTWTNFVLGPTWSGSRPPTGTVTLYNNGVAIVTLQLGGDGKAYYTTQPPLNVGVNNLTVSYSGDSMFPAGVSGVTTITVLPAPVNFQASCEGALVYGQTYQCQVNLSAGTPTPPVGNITYSFDGGAPVAVSINSFGNAPFLVPGIPSAGTHTLAITYAAQGNYAAAGTLQRGFTTQPGQTQLLISPSTYFTAHGSTITLSGLATTLVSGTPVGTVTFYDNGNSIGSVSVGSNGQVSLPVPNVAKGQHTYYATFAGTSNYAAVTSGNAIVTAY